MIPSRLNENGWICELNVWMIRKIMSKDVKNKTLIGCLCALGCEVLFGLSYVFTKRATESAGTFELLGWRFFTAGAIIIVAGIYTANSGKRRKKVE